MKEYDATELAYKNGYKKGTTDTLQKIKMAATMYVGTYINNDKINILDMCKFIDQFSDEILDNSNDEQSDG